MTRRWVTFASPLCRAQPGGLLTMTSVVKTVYSLQPPALSGGLASGGCRRRRPNPSVGDRRSASGFARLALCYPARGWSFSRAGQQPVSGEVGGTGRRSARQEESVLRLSVAAFQRILYSWLVEGVEKVCS